MQPSADVRRVNFRAQGKGRPPVALIIDHGASRSALAGARALAAAGWRVVIGSPAPATLAGASRSVAGMRHVPGPEAGLDVFTAAAAAAAAEEGARLVLPSDDDQLPAPRCGGAESGAAPMQRTRSCCGRRTSSSCTMRPGAPASRAPRRPRRRRRSSPLGLARDRQAAPALPDGPKDAPAPLPVRRVSTPNARARGRRNPAGGGSRCWRAVDGEHLSFAAVANRDGRVVACLQQRTSRRYPPEAGISVRAVLLRVDPVLLERIERPLAELGWLGLVQLRSALARRAAAPDRLQRPALRFARVRAARRGEPPGGVGGGRRRPRGARARRGPSGVRYQWLEGDLQAARGEVRRGPPPSPAPSPSRRAPAIASGTRAIPAPRRTARAARPPRRGASAVRLARRGA